MMLAQVITEHTMVIMVSNGEVLSALTDEVFYEITETILHIDTSLDNAEQLALEWSMAAPTYRFDGTEGSMSIIDTVVAESCPVQYYISISFNCAQPSYGDRTGEVLAQVVTEHIARILVSSGEVRGAVIDDAWDELNQREVIGSELLPPEKALNIVIGFLSENYDEVSTLNVDIEWEIEDQTPENHVGSSTLVYSDEGWTISI
jgi:hypothetical protein